MPLVRNKPKPRPADTPQRVLARKAREQWTKNDAPPPLVGKRLVLIRPMTSQEVAAERWEYNLHTLPAALVFDDGTVVFAAKDPYGDGGAGVLVGNDATGRPFQLRSVPEGYRLDEPPPWPAAPCSKTTRPVPTYGLKNVTAVRT